ncbi:DUF167 domain-containing protein [Lacipirellula limnantheis]|uniref:UPF0235 protein I41_22830 n=1 Tax=Lacipirellula limnantheis TaxID=2528024 RepID=A0A517TXJ3_9BACT|nr:DUF167 domain-containing protein [Lacipirellula limnantheis]QDT73094.1 hypothetical protein I41_22830 [Lacipirellula limnantheis]
MTPLESHPQGAVIRVKARPGARRNALAGHHDGALRVDVTAAPEKGKANDAIIVLLAKSFGIAKSSIELISSPANPQKRFLLAGVDLAAVEKRLSELL